MTTEEYIELRYKWYEITSAYKKYNKDLVDRYPFLNPFLDSTEEKQKAYDYEWTWLDELPDGWRIAFGEDLVKELDDELRRVNFVDQYRIVQIKEKWGGLRWYDGGVPINSAIHDIIRKYEELSYRTCIRCGKPAKYITNGWISPFCEDCVKKDVICSYHELTDEDIPKWETIK